MSAEASEAARRLDIQRRMLELGRVRLGERGAKGEPKRLDTFRFTSASRALLDAVAELYGGTVREWKDAPDEGYFEVTTSATELNIILPPVCSSADGTPTASYSRWFELWTDGGCQRRCDGQTEALSGKPCLCDPETRACHAKTRISFMLPEIPGLGVWRLESKGWHAAVELPGTLGVLLMAAAKQQFVPAVLRIEHRTKKVPGQGTRRFVVPVIDLPQVRVADMLAADDAADEPRALNAPRPVPPRPELPSGAPAPPHDVAARFENDDSEPSAKFGERPALPDESEAPAASSDLASAAQVRNIERLVGQFEKAGLLTREQVKTRIAKEFGAEHFSDLTKTQASQIIERLKAKAGET